MTTNTEWETIQEGDKKAFELLYKAHYSMLCAFAYRYVKEHDEAEEVVQHTFYTLWKNRTKITISSSVTSYLMQAVKHNCYNKIKKHQLERDYMSTSDFQYEEHDTPLDKAAFSELEDKMMALIEQLPTERRKVFVLSRFEGKKYREIATHLGISVKTVENQMGKALQFMRMHLQDYLSIWLMAIMLIKMMARMGVFDTLIVYML